MEAQCKDGVTADGVASLIVAAAERRGLLGIREHDASLGHEMRGPAGTGRGGVSMAGGREGQLRETTKVTMKKLLYSEFIFLMGARKENGVRGHRLPSPPCFVHNFLMYFGFLSRSERLLVNILCTNT